MSRLLLRGPSNQIRRNAPTRVPICRPRPTLRAGSDGMPIYDIGILLRNSDILSSTSPQKIGAGLEILNQWTSSNKGKLQLLIILA